jgi:hypothetical protein
MVAEPTKPEPLNFRVVEDMPKQQYAGLAAHFNNTCCVCHKPPVENETMLVYVDSKTDRICGLVCADCDGVIFHLEDNPGWLQAAAKFVTGQG